jgi:LacI family transcriptional regulator
VKARLIDVAELAKVSRTTAFRVLNGGDGVKESTYKKVMKAAEQLNYSPNRFASALRTKQSKVIGAVFSNLFSGHFYSDIYKGIEDIAFKKGYTIILGSADENSSKERKFIRSLAEQQAEGIIAAPLSKHDRESFEMLKKYDIPVVFVDKYIEGFEADRVITDNYLGGEIVAEYLLSLGHRDIALCKGYGWNTTSTYFREQGFVNCLRRHGVPGWEELEFENPLDHAMKYAYQATQKRKIKVLSLFSASLKAERTNSLCSMLTYEPSPAVGTNSSFN